MDTNLMIGITVVFALVGVAVSRDLMRRMRSKSQLVPVRVRRDAGRR
jgi:hypothetical protein